MRAWNSTAASWIAERPFSIVRLVADGQARRGRPPRFSPDELLDVVVAEFIARGYDATTMEDLARATGLTKSSLYHHVSGKEELLRLAVARAVDALFDVLEESPATTGPAVDRLEPVLRR